MVDMGSSSNVPVATSRDGAHAPDELSHPILFYSHSSLTPHPPLLSSTVSAEFFRWNLRQAITKFEIELYGKSIKSDEIRLPFWQ
jgi:hypothetical protein